MIYIKTDMTEMPKGCSWVELIFDFGAIRLCPYKNGKHCVVSKEHKEVAKHNCKRPDWCPLIRKEDIK